VWIPVGPSPRLVPVPRPRPHAIALAIAGLALVVRVAYVLGLRDHPLFEAPAMDAGYHLAWAEALARGEEFRDGPFFRAPLYPIVLAAIVKATGGAALALRLVQAGFGAATAYLTYRLTRRLTGEEPPALVASALTALSWVLVAFDAELLIPTLLVPLLLLALERLLAWDLTDRPRQAALVGALFGLAAIARPNVLLLMPVLFVWTVARNRGARAALALTAGTLAPILPVTLHNALEGDATLIATQAGVNLWIGNNPESDGVTAIVPGTRDGWWEGHDDAVAMAEAAEGRELAATEVSAHYLGRAAGWMREEPAAAAAHLARKARLLAGDRELANNQPLRFTAERAAPWLVAVPVRWSVLLGLGAVGAAVTLRRGRPGAPLLLAFIGVYSASIVLFFVTARFRVPLLPVLAAFSGVAIVEVARAARARSWGALAGLVGPAAAIAALSLLASGPGGGAAERATGLAGLGRAEIARGRSLTGLRLLEDAHAADPRNPQIAADFAAELSRIAGEHDRALDVLARAAEAARGTPFGQDARSAALVVLVAAGRAPEALRAADAMIAAGEADGRVRIARAQALAALDRPGEARAELEALVRDQPNDPVGWLLLARTAAALGDAVAAREAYARVIELERFAPRGLVEEARAALGR